MLKKIKLKNFMSHKSSEFELVKGINVITGPNNSGKSAVISALQMLADLPVKEGDYMVRHGASHSSVTIETGEGDELSWQRKGSTMSLMINEEKDMRLQNNREHYLEKLHKHLKLPKVSSSETKQDFDIHFATQKSPIFLINEPPSRAALFFASSSDAGRLFEVRDKYKDLVKAKKKEKQTTKSAWEQQKNILIRLAPLDAIEELFKCVQEIYKQFPKEQEALRTGSMLLEAFKHYTLKFNRCAAKHALHQKVIPPPPIQDACKLEYHHKALCEEISHASILAERCKAFLPLAHPPALFCTHNITKNLQELQRTDRRKQRFAQMQSLLALTKAQPEIEDAESLERLLKAMQEHKKALTLLNAECLLLKEAQCAPEMEPESNFRVFLKNFHFGTAMERKLRARVEKLVQVCQVPEIGNLPQIEKVHFNLKSLDTKLLLEKHIHQALQELQSPPHISNLTKFEELLADLKITLKKYAGYSKRIQFSSKSIPLPEFEDHALLERDLTKQRMHLADVQKLTVQLKEAELALQTWVSEHPTCPSCGGNLNIEKLQASICNGK